MADGTKIEWSDATWNVITGCSVVSPGCTNCYAMRLAGGRLRNHPSRKGLTKPSNAGPVWTGKVRFNEEWLKQPLSWNRPRMIFVCAHGDLGHPSIPDEWVDAVFAVMALAGRHIFQVLTKRPDVMKRHIERIGCSINILERQARKLGWTLKFDGIGLIPWPLPNVWLGTSAERQKEADERIPDLLKTPASVRFVSLEPLLGPISLWKWDEDEAALRGCGVIESGGVTPSTPDNPPEGYDDSYPGLDWVIVGGESGPHARNMEPDWARDLCSQCDNLAVPFFMKQMARKAPIPPDLMVRQFPLRAPQHH